MKGLLMLLFKPHFRCVDVREYSADKPVMESKQAFHMRIAIQNNDANRSPRAFRSAHTPRPSTDPAHVEMDS